jgi:hypothetical protein
MEHKILPSGLHAIIVNGRINIYTEEEYQHLSWWAMIKLKYNL